MAWFTEAEFNYRMDVADDRYSTAIQRQAAPNEQPSPLTGLARVVVAWELLHEAWEHEKAKARAEMTRA